MTLGIEDMDEKQREALFLQMDEEGRQAMLSYAGERRRMASARFESSNRAIAMAHRLAEEALRESVKFSAVIWQLEKLQESEG